MLTPEPEAGGWAHYAYAVKPEHAKALEEACRLVARGDEEAAAAVLEKVPETRELDPTTPIDVAVLALVRDRFRRSLARAAARQELAPLGPALEAMSLEPRPVSSVAERELARLALNTDLLARPGVPSVLVDEVVRGTVGAIARLDRRRMISSFLELLPTREWVERIACPALALGIGTYADVLHLAWELHEGVADAPSFPSVEALVQGRRVLGEGEAARCAIDDWWIDETGAGVDALYTRTREALRALSSSTKRHIVESTESQFAELAVRTDEWLALLDERLARLAEGTREALERGLVMVSCLERPTR